MSLVSSIKNGIIGLAMLGTLNACSTASCPPMKYSKTPAFTDIGDFTLAKKTKKKNLKPLEEVVSEPNRTIKMTIGGPTMIKVEIKPNLSSFPEVVYHVDVVGNPNQCNSLIPLVKSGGSAFLLNKEGFFLSTYHQFDDHIEKQKKGNKNSMMLFYDPINGFATEAEVLMFSKKFDILLGRVRVDPDAEVEPQKIFDGDQPTIDQVFSATYQNIDYFLSGKMYHAVVNSGDITEAPQGLTYNQTLSVKVRKLLSLKHTIDIGHIVPGITFVDDNKNKQPWKRIFFGEVNKGNSGSPIYDVSNNIVGIVTEIPSDDILKAFPKLKKANDMTIYTGALHIRAMVKSYIAHHVKE
jgi:hypothetical protein